MNAPDVRVLDSLLGGLSTGVAAAIDRALTGDDLSIDDAVTLFDCSGADMQALTLAADHLRREQAGEQVTYVVNRNINFTNVCIKRCGFCAFSRDYRMEEGYLLPIDEIVRRAREAVDLGATEVCIQAGLPPKMEGDLYERTCRALKAELPELHIHGFSPEEVLYGSIRSRCSIPEMLRRLKDAGVGSLPGTSAEILVQDVRDRISPGRITVDQWVEVITSAHELGIPTTSTIMYGHVETSEHKARHLSLLRDVQRRSGGITEFVPLSFVHSEAPMHQNGLIEGVRDGATQAEVVKMYAVSRLMLGRDIKNLQVSWVKDGTRLAQLLLGAGANDFGGTLINESISTAAGAEHGQLVRPVQFRSLIREAGRIPAERTTTYGIRRVFADPADDPVEPLDTVEYDEKRFGTFNILLHQEENRFRDTFSGVGGRAGKG
ncbi:MAG: 5-amino-6-(D-ribitylamino)uracil--L-tyrosine 4-hydroxyphenyl transferase CofH [Chloroflexi bacterium]|nr:5-amino-6-(D-ribitylamino)uracil--L-tyrosine 4-hydroxyphenyl transferase CofH [Chloroflexota bacterium]